MRSRAFFIHILQVTHCEDGGVLESLLPEEMCILDN